MKHMMKYFSEYSVSLKHFVFSKPTVEIESTEKVIVFKVIMLGTNNLIRYSGLRFVCPLKPLRIFFFSSFLLVQIFYSG